MKFLPSFFQTNSIILVEEETIVDLLLSYHVWKISSSQFFFTYHCQEQMNYCEMTNKPFIIDLLQHVINICDV
jgi:hypothetical protein